MSILKRIQMSILKCLIMFDLYRGQFYVILGEDQLPIQEIRIHRIHKSDYLANFTNLTN